MNDGLEEQPGTRWRGPVRRNFSILMAGILVLLLALEVPTVIWTDFGWGSLLQVAITLAIIVAIYALARWVLAKAYWDMVVLMVTRTPEEARDAVHRALGSTGYSFEGPVEHQILGDRWWEFRFPFEDLRVAVYRGGPGTNIGVGPIEEVNSYKAERVQRAIEEALG